MGTDFSVFFFGSFGTVSEDVKWLIRPFLYKNIILKTIVAVKDGHKAHDFSPMGNMIWRIAGAGTISDASQRSADQIMDHSDALCCHAQRDIGKQDVVIDQRWSMADFDKEILAHHSSL